MKRYYLKKPAPNENYYYLNNNASLQGEKHHTSNISSAYMHTDSEILIAYAKGNIDDYDIYEVHLTGVKVNLNVSFTHDVQIKDDVKPNTVFTSSNETTNIL